MLQLPFNCDGTTAAKGQGMRVRVVGNFYGEKQGPKYGMNNSIKY